MMLLFVCDRVEEFVPLNGTRSAAGYLKGNSFPILLHEQCFPGSVFWQSSFNWVGFYIFRRSKAAFLFTVKKSPVQVQT